MNLIRFLTIALLLVNAVLWPSLNAWWTCVPWLMVAAAAWRWAK